MVFLAAGDLRARRRPTAGVARSLYQSVNFLVVNHYP